MQRRWTVTYKTKDNVEIAITLNADDIFKAIEAANQYYSQEDWTITDVTSYEL